MTSTSQTFRRSALRLGLAALAVLALGVLAAPGSASAATQHWASSPQVQTPYGSPVEYTGEATTRFIFEWDSYGLSLQIDCESMSTSGTVENPAEGEAGELTAESFELGGCTTNRECQITNEGSIAFNPMVASTADESGEDLIEYEPSGGSFFTLHLENCFFEGSYPVSGSLVARSGDAGEYEIEEGELKIESTELALSGRYALSNSSEEAVVLTSEGTPGTPHWQIGVVEWSKLAQGTPVTYSSASMSFVVKSELGGLLPVRISCSGASTGLEGTVENPSGGDPGVATGTMTLGNCTTNIGCEVKTPIQPPELSGTATEVGEEKAPAVDWSVSESEAFASIKLENCLFEGTYELYLGGNLIANSTEDGHFQLSSEEGEVELEGEPATVTGQMTLKRRKPKKSCGSNPDRVRSRCPGPQRAARGVAAPSPGGLIPTDTLGRFGVKSELEQASPGQVSSR